jgi:hypothetical protein
MATKKSAGKKKVHKVMSEYNTAALSQAPEKK